MPNIPLDQPAASCCSAAAALLGGRPSERRSKSWGTWKVEASPSRLAGHRAGSTGSRASQRNWYNYRSMSS